jgi:hypothetical protein
LRWWCGYKKAAIEDRPTPETLTSTKRWPAWMIVEHEGSFHDSDDTCSLMACNDNTDIRGDEREKEIAAIFARHGVEVEFVGGEP